ncbi:hypothetical protein KHS38_07460 [Mucilaginibacter sp. Bleaf8]|uniref:hypothetical protein n=1 Tax=Mucilaginibacter sp. Bleaf8 TaxID=2834430 RepID=UPI001BCD3A62|nr:hypothetical protein [Mucilaginibacter sp. Bleaf8]MBS7564239.1 hypothetical protein [Mucilaginibacter sp. Bleaf8]
MGENFTFFSNEITDKAMVNEQDIIEHVDADSLIFYHALRTEMDLLQAKPKKQTIDKILDYSKSLR